MSRGRPGAGTRVITLPDVSDMGPKMRALSEGHRAFVLAYIAIGGRSQTEAAIMAGYSDTPRCAGVTSTRIAHRQDVQDAIFEEMKKQGRIDLVSRYANVRLIADSSPKDEVRLKANLELMNIAGLGGVTRHEVVIEDRRSTKDILEEIKRLASETGDEGKLIAGDIIDAEFEEVTDGSEGLEDIL